MIAADGRHLRRMLACISSLRAGSISLVQGADQLLALRDALEGIDAFDQAWFDGFTSHLVTIESAGVTSSGQVLERHGQPKPYVIEALDQLEAMIRERLRDGGAPDGDEQP